MHMPWRVWWHEEESGGLRFLEVQELHGDLPW